MCITKPSRAVKDSLGQDLSELDFGKNYEDSCSYIDTEELEMLKYTPNHLTICFLNIRGLTSKQSDISKFLTQSIKFKKNWCFIACWNMAHIQKWT